MQDTDEGARLQARADRLHRVSLFISVAFLVFLVVLRIVGQRAPAGEWIVAVGLVVSGVTGVIRLPHRVTMAVLTTCIVAMLGGCITVIVNAAR